MCTKFDKSSIYSARPLFSSRFSGLGHDILTRSIEHQEHSMTGIWKASHATEHSKYCHGRFKVLNRDRGNIVNTSSWKPLFRKMNMIRHTNAVK